MTEQIGPYARAIEINKIWYSRINEARSNSYFEPLQFDSSSNHFAISFNLDRNIFGERKVILISYESICEYMRADGVQDPTVEKIMTNDNYIPLIAATLYKIAFDYVVSLEKER